MEMPGELDDEECWALLSLASLGRIALSVRALPAILPVQYYLDERTLAICLGQYKIPSTSVVDTVVAFAVDAVDSSAKTGWTVQVQGVAHLPTSDGTPRDCGQPAAGQVVHLEPSVVTGHRISLCPFVPGH